LTEIMNFTLNGAILCLGGKFRNTCIGCHLRRSPMYENFRAFAIGEHRR
jgi:hypothetical protein